MIWLLNDFDVLSMLLRGVTLSLEALLAGGVLFLLAAGLPSGANEHALRACRRGIQWIALAMILAEIASVAVQTALVVGTAGITTLQALRGGPVFAASGPVAPGAIAERRRGADQIAALSTAHATPISTAATVSLVRLQPR